MEMHLPATPTRERNVCLLIISLLLLSIPDTCGRVISDGKVNQVVRVADAVTSTVQPQEVVKSSSTTPPTTAMEPILAIPLKNEIVCPTVSILNSVDNFDKLRNCTVIEGSLKIFLIDEPEKPYESLHFPNLREVTGYVMIYRVSGLKSLKNIFPNLSVIRGTALLRDNALIVFENKDLEEIGLISLTKIVRGAVYIWRNSALCYVDTVNWKRLTDKDFWETNSIRENKAEDQCANQCPGQHCQSFFEKRSRKACWTGQDCQKFGQEVCSENATLHEKAGSCCHSHCLSGCFGMLRNNCLVCQTVHSGGACMPDCPAFQYKLQGRRCVSAEYCRTYTGAPGPIWKAHNGECVTECPARFTPHPNDTHTCIACVGSCPKECPGGVVDSLASAEALKECTIINGSLDIQVGKGDQVVRAMETALQNIEVVRDYVKVVRSHALLSLGFFKRLRLIEGKNLMPGLYALNVIDNQNLQDLFEMTKERPSLQIGNASAKIAFHFNPHLCRSKIDAFVRKVGPGKGIDDYDDRDISRISNGDRAACDMKTLKLRVEKIPSGEVILKWDAFTLPDSRSLLGYLLLYRQAPARNLSKFEGRDACSVNVWTQVDVPPQEDNLNERVWSLSHLKPAQQYGAYVTTYTVASEKQGAQSDIVYFSTAPKTPGKPASVRTESLNSSAIRVHWKAPSDPNGVVTNYLIKWTKRRGGHQRLAMRNYCNNPIQLSRQIFEDTPKTTTPVPLHGCPCNGTDASGKVVIPNDIKEAQAEYEQAIIMENLIQDNVFTKSARDRRSISEDATGTPPISYLDISSTVNTSTPTLTTLHPNNITTPQTPRPPLPEITLIRKVTEGDSFVITDLHHFTDYAISVAACHDLYPGIDYGACSEDGAASAVQTLAKRGADDIPSDSVTVRLLKEEKGVEGVPMLAVGWQDPKEPNGIIVTVDIEAINLDRPSESPRIECVPTTLASHRRPFHKLGLQRMQSGNHSFRLRASSFAGNGSWTAYQYFYIEETLIGTSNLGVSPSTMAGIICGVILSFLLFIGVGCLYYKPWVKKIPEDPLIVSVNPDYYSYTPDEWEVPRHKIDLLQELGTGSFGKVYLGIGTNIEPDKDVSRVAVKTVNEDKSVSERSFFLQEASIMKAFRCHHVVKLIGVVSEGQPALVIMELMERGDLKTYLRQQRPDEEHPDRIPPTLSRIFQMTGEICDGMAYIHSRKYVHRDLAARNCMINQDLTVKIGDFGMTRDVYETDYYRKGGKGLLPVRWMAPESLKDGLFTNESDVWSFGVVLWEIVTLAEQPYRGMSNEEVLQYVIRGRHINPISGKEELGYMPMPEGCNLDLYALMERCWKFKGRDRPTFMQIVDELYDKLSQSFHEKSYFSTVDLTDTPPPGMATDSQENPLTGQELQQVGPKVVSLLRAQPGAGGSDEDEARETDELLEASTGDASPIPSPPSVGVPLEANIIIEQNGASPPSSADNSRSMAMAFSDGGMHHAKRNGSATNGVGEKVPRTMY